MRPPTPRTFALTLFLGCAIAGGACGGSAGTPASPTAVAANPAAPIEVPVNESPVQPTTPPTPVTNWVNVFGDTGWCGSPAMPLLSRLMATLGGDIFLAGDLAYPDGTIAEFQRCFHPDFGRFRSRFWAVPGNHDYQTAGADGYFTYFGDRAGPARRGYYSVRSATWQVLMLDSLVPIGRNSPQFQWVRAELLANPARCTLAVMHYPFDSSGPNGPNPQLRDVWEVMHAQGVDVVVAGHDHLYERHAPQDANGRADPARGIRLFIAGTGGATPYGRARAAVHSERLISSYGLLRLKLEPALYEWEFMDVNGSVQDRGLNVCH
ncbi:MAG: metallophosphoesterase [Acidobacteriota bacterium]|nr:metallophosphoesterase [Acidobacteriota bacterium]